MWQRLGSVIGWYISNAKSQVVLMDINMTYFTFRLRLKLLPFMDSEAEVEFWLLEWSLIVFFILILSKNRSLKNKGFLLPYGFDIWLWFSSDFSRNWVQIICNIFIYYKIKKCLVQCICLTVNLNFFTLIFLSCLQTSDLCSKSGFPKILETNMSIYGIAANKKGIVVIYTYEGTTQIVLSTTLILY